MSDLKQEVIGHIDSMRDRLIEVSKEIHSNPETKFEEFKACDLLCEELKKGGFMVKRPVAGLETAFTAHGVTKKVPARPVFAFLLEYDALPEIGHACGHNLIATAGLGAAVALERSILSATVAAIGTPAEEGGGGKARMIEAGVFADIDVALMFHPSFKDEVGERMMAVQEVAVSRVSVLLTVMRFFLIRLPTIIAFSFSRQTAARGWCCGLASKTGPHPHLHLQRWTMHRRYITFGYL